MGVKWRLSVGTDTPLNSPLAHFILIYTSSLALFFSELLLASHLLLVFLGVCHPQLLCSSVSLSQSFLILSSLSLVVIRTNSPWPL